MLKKFNFGLAREKNDFHLKKNFMNGKIYGFINLMLLMFLSISFTYGQRNITGQVTDNESGKTLPGVMVLVKGTSVASVTDLDGKYLIKVPANNDTLEFSMIGMETQEVPITSDIINVVMSPSATSEIQQVVVIGYGKVKKSDATGSVTTVSSKDFNHGQITTPQELLVGKTAGVVLTSSNGAPGTGFKIRIRGGSSLNASNDPLIIVDGVPLDNHDVSGSSNPLSFINPSDIESFTILKDASATAIYGSRASNGVIIITTKKGKQGAPLSISYDGVVTVSTPIAFLNVYTGDEFRQIAQEHKDIYDTSLYSLLGNQNTDWQAKIFRTSVSYDHNLSLSGSYKILPYRVSMGYTNQQGILLNTGLKRITGAINLNPTLLHNNLKVNINAKVMNINNNFGDYGAVGSAISMDPTQPVKDSTEAMDGYFQWQTYGANLGTPNPVEQALAIDNKSVNNRFVGNIKLDYTLPFLPDLTATLNVGTDYNVGKGHSNRPTTSPSTLISPLAWGRLSDYGSENKNSVLDFYLNYNKDLEAIKSKIDFTAGYSWEHFQRQGSSYTRGIVDDLHPYQKSDSSQYITENYLVSFFGRANYSLLDRYLLTATVRYDGSSRFAEGNRWGLFPSAAFAWKIKEEKFLKNVSAISELKLRLGWGVTGQQDIGNDYPAMAKYTLSSEGSYYFFDGQFIPTLRPDAYDPNIRWEKTTTKNIGLDFGFLKNRLFGSVDLYYRVTDNLLNTVTIPSGSNFSNRLLTNVGSLENKGIEASMNVVIVSTKNTSLTLNTNFTYQKNKITKLLLNDDPNYIGILYGSAFTGQNQVTRVGYPAYSFFVNRQIYDADGKPIEGLYEDISGQGGAVNGNNEDKYIYHNPAPDYILGMGIRFNYKNFDFSTSARAYIGNYVLNGVVAGASYDQMQQIGYWKNMPSALSNTNFVKRQFTSDYFVENASFLKVDNIGIGYSFKPIDKLSLRFTFTVQNAFIYTKYSGLDPEVDGGIDNNFYPRPRNYVIGLNIKF